MLRAALARVIRTLTLAEKLEYLRRLSPSDYAAVILIIDDCLAHRWPKTPSEWFAIAERISAKH